MNLAALLPSQIWRGLVNAVIRRVTGSEPNQVIGGFRVWLASALTSRLSKTRVRIGVTA